MKSRTFVTHDTFDLRGSTALFAQAWSPDAELRGVIGIVHGLGEHSGRYASMAERFARAGYRVVAYDQRGHGQTAGRRGDAPSYEVLLDDIETLLVEMKATGAGPPMFLFGHSLGGNLVLNYAIRRQPSLHGLVVSSPLLSPTHPPPRWKQLAARLLLRLHPSFRFRTGVPPEGLSHDPTVVAAYMADPLVHDMVSARLAVAMLDAGQFAIDRAAELDLPTLLMHGEADPITSAEASMHFHRQAGRVCALHVFPGLFHELHRERQCDEVFDVVLEWLNQYVCV